MPPEILLRPDQGLQPDGTVRIMIGMNTNLEISNNGCELDFFNRAIVTEFIEKLSRFVNLNEEELKENSEVLDSVAQFLTNERQLEEGKDLHIKFNSEEGKPIINNDSILVFSNQDAINRTFMMLLPEGSMYDSQRRRQQYSSEGVFKILDVLHFGKDQLNLLKQQIVVQENRPEVRNKALEVIDEFLDKREKTPIEFPQGRNRSQDFNSAVDDL